MTPKTELTHHGEHPHGESLECHEGDRVAFEASTETGHQSFDAGGFSTGPITIDIGTETKASLASG